LPKTQQLSGALEIADLPQIRYFETVQIAYFGFKHIILREAPAPFVLEEKGEIKCDTVCPKTFSIIGKPQFQKIKGLA